MCLTEDSDIVWLSISSMLNESWDWSGPAPFRPVIHHIREESQGDTWSTRVAMDEYYHKCHSRCSQLYPVVTFNVVKKSIGITPRSDIDCNNFLEAFLCSCNSYRRSTRMNHYEYLFKVDFLSKKKLTQKKRHHFLRVNKFIDTDDI